MRATVTQEFKGRPDHEFDTRIFRVGDTVTGDLAAVAVREGWATEGDAAPVEQISTEATEDETHDAPVKKRGRPRRTEETA
jgi:hypothetical protein